MAIFDFYDDLGRAYLEYHPDGELLKTAAYVAPEDLPDTAFAYVGPDGRKFPCYDEDVARISAFYLLTQNYEMDRENTKVAAVNLWNASLARGEMPNTLLPFFFDDELMAMITEEAELAKTAGLADSLLRGGMNAVRGMGRGIASAARGVGSALSGARAFLAPKLPSFGSGRLSSFFSSMKKPPAVLPHAEPPMPAPKASPVPVEDVARAPAPTVNASPQAAPAPVSASSVRVAPPSTGTPSPTLSRAPEPAVVSRVQSYLPEGVRPSAEVVGARVRTDLRDVMPALERAEFNRMGRRGDFRAQLDRVQPYVAAAPAPAAASGEAAVSRAPRAAPAAAAAPEAAPVAAEPRAPAAPAPEAAAAPPAREVRPQAKAEALTQPMDAPTVQPAAEVAAPSASAASAEAGAGVAAAAPSTPRPSSPATFTDPSGAVRTIPGPPPGATVSLPSGDVMPPVAAVAAPPPVVPRVGPEALRAPMGPPASGAAAAEASTAARAESGVQSAADDAIRGVRSEGAAAGELRQPTIPVETPRQSLNQPPTFEARKATAQQNLATAQEKFSILDQKVKDAGGIDAAFKKYQNGQFPDLMKHQALQREIGQLQNDIEFLDRSIAGTPFPPPAAAAPRASAPTGTPSGGGASRNPLTRWLESAGNAYDDAGRQLYTRFLNNGRVAAPAAAAAESRAAAAAEGALADDAAGSATRAAEPPTAAPAAEPPPPAAPAAEPPGATPAPEAKAPGAEPAAPSSGAPTEPPPLTPAEMDAREAALSGDIDRLTSEAAATWVSNPVRAEAVQAELQAATARRDALKAYREGTGPHPDAVAPAATPPPDSPTVNAAPAADTPEAAEHANVFSRLFGAAQSVTAAAGGASRAIRNALAATPAFGNYLAPEVLAAIRNGGPEAEAMAGQILSRLGGKHLEITNAYAARRGFSPFGNAQDLAKAELDLMATNAARRMSPFGEPPIENILHHQAYQRYVLERAANPNAIPHPEIAYLAPEANAAAEGGEGFFSGLGNGNMTPLLVAGGLAGVGGYMLGSSGREANASAPETYNAHEALRALKDTWADLDPAEKRNYAVALSKTASAQGVVLPDEVSAYAGTQLSPYFSSVMRDRVDYVRQPELAEQYARLAKVAAAMDTDELVDVLYRLDDAAGLVHRYGKRLPDPYRAVYTPEKTASCWSWSHGSHHLTEAQLLRFATAPTQEQMLKLFTQDTVTRLRREPVATFKKLPVEQQIIVARMATQSGLSNDGGFRG